MNKVDIKVLEELLEKMWSKGMDSCDDCARDAYEDCCDMLDKVIEEYR